VLTGIARWCFGLARIWRMSILITWLCERTKLMGRDSTGQNEDGKGRGP
jgi:hypothetical protein